MVSQQNDFSDMELVAHGLLAEVLKSLGRYEEALLHREACTNIHEQIFNRDTDLRIKTLQISHDTLAARDQAELLRVRTTELEELVTARTQDLEEQHYEAFERLAAIAEYRDPDSGEHSSRVGELAAEIALQLDEDPAWAEELRLAGRLHDVGKVGVPDAILQKPGTLTGAGVRDHEDAHHGRRHRLRRQPFDPASNWLRRSPSLTTSDGTAVAIRRAQPAPTSRSAAASSPSPTSTTRSVTAHRYKHAWTSQEAVGHVVAGRGTQFESRIVDALVAVIARREVE